MRDITSIEELIESLDDADPFEQGSILKRMNIPKRHFYRYASWSPASYTRNCITRNDKYELILLCWDISSKTPVHDHDGQDCWVYQVEGSIKERRYKNSDRGNLVESNQMTFSPGKIAYMNDRMGYHAIENCFDQRAMSLHLYASPIDSCHVYNEISECFEVKELAYCTEVTEEVLY